MPNPLPPLPDQRFTLTAPPPVRALAIGATTVVLGATAVVLAAVLTLPTAITVLGVLLLLAGLALAVAALVLSRRLTVVLRLSGDQAVLQCRGGEQALRWSDVRTVTLDHPRLVLTSRAEGRPDLVVVNPRRPDDAAFGQLVRALQARLDRDRGYGR